MSKILARCREILAERKCQDLERSVSAVARQMNVSVTDEQVQKAALCLKYGRVVW